LGGEPLRRAARIEPHVTAGEIWGTEDFRQVLESQPTRYQATHVPPRESAGGPKGSINVKKPGSSEPDNWLRLYCIEPRRHDGCATLPATRGITSLPTHSSRRRYSSKVSAPTPTWNAVAPAARQRAASATTASAAAPAAAVRGATSSNGPDRPLL